jgi:Protein of unknown function (DUF3592)
MPRRPRRTNPLSVVYFVVVLGLLVGSSVWLDQRGETAAATVKSKHEEVTIQQEPRGGWDRWYRVGVEFPTRDDNLGMATLTLPRARYDALRLGDTLAVHYFPAFPLLARAADRTTLQAAGDALGRLVSSPALMRSLVWLLAGVGALWIASWIATPLVVLAGLAWMGAGLLLLFPALSPSRPGPTTTTARVAAVNLISKAPARNGSRRHRSSLGDDSRRLAMPYQVVQLRFPSPGHPDSTLAVDAVDSGSIAGLQVGIELPIRYDPASPRDAQLAVGSRSYLERNRYHFRTPVLGIGLLGILAAWGARTRRRVTSPARAPAVAAG